MCGYERQKPASQEDDRHLEAEAPLVDRTAPDMADVGLPDIVGTVRLGQHPSYIGGRTRRGLSHSNPLADVMGETPPWLPRPTDPARDAGARAVRRPAAPDIWSRGQHDPQIRPFWSLKKSLFRWEPHPVRHPHGSADSPAPFCGGSAPHGPVRKADRHVTPTHTIASVRVWHTI